MVGCCCSLLTLTVGRSADLEYEASDQSRPKISEQILFPPASKISQEIRAFKTRTLVYKGSVNQSSRKSKVRYGANH